MRSERALEAQYRQSTAQPKNATSPGRFAVLVSSCPSWLMFAPDAVIDSQKTIQANVRKKCCQADYSSRQEEDDRDIGLNTLLIGKWQTRRSARAALCCRPSDMGHRLNGTRRMRCQ